MSAYELGQRVRIHGTAVKDGTRDKMTYREAPQPKRFQYPNDRVFSEGVIVGSRTVQEGYVEWDEWSSGFTPLKGTAKRVWLVAFDLRMKPCMCFDHQIEPLP